MVFLVELDRLERLVKMDYQEKLDGLANEGIEEQKDNRLDSYSIGLIVRSSSLLTDYFIG